MNLQSIPKGKDLLLSLDLLNDAGTVQSLASFYNFIAYVKIGEVTTKYSLLSKADYEPFYISSDILKVIKIKFDKINAGKVGDNVIVTWFTQKVDPVNSGEYINTPIKEILVGQIKANATYIESL